jgi:hypothetical protein
VRKRIPPVVRFWRYVKRSAGCWEWTGYLDKDGYGQFRLQVDGKWTYRKAHVLMYRWYVGPVPRGRFVCHRCDNPWCVYPGHLFVGTHAENEADKDQKGRRPSGETSYVARLTEKDARTIRRLCEQSQAMTMKERKRCGLTLSGLATRFGLSKGGIYSVVLRRSWRHVA